MTDNLETPVADRNLYFFMNAEDAGRKKEIWRYTNVDAKVSIGKRFMMEYYFKEGNAENGRGYLAITPPGVKKQVIYDIKNFTRNTSDPDTDGFTGYNPMKLCTSKELVALMKLKGESIADLLG